MNKDLNRTGSSDRCREFGDRFQEYLDGTLPKQDSLALFLHVRECQTCHEQLEETRQVFRLLEALPPVPIPDEFNEKILSSVPYHVYKAMAPLRQERLPVFLEEEFLPAPVRAPATRAAGGVLAALTAGGVAISVLPAAATLAVVVGLLPEALVRLQAAARRLTLAVQKSHGH
jgi:anti-sigma factor RsiW